MKKRFLALVAIAALVVAPTFANVLDDAKMSLDNATSKMMSNTTHPMWSAGLNIGTTPGVQVNYKASTDLTMETVVGFGLLNQELSVEYYGMYNVTDFEVNDAMFNVNAGLGVSLGATFGDNSEFNVAPLAAGEIVYSFDDDFPIDLGLRIGAGPSFKITDNDVEYNFGFSAGLFGLWRFI